MRIGKGIMTPGRILFLLLATVFPWKAVAGGVPLPVSRYVDAALADNPSLDAMQERIRMKRERRDSGRGARRSEAARGGPTCRSGRPISGKRT